jgi:uncharacterized protein (TIGR00369 family)
VSISQPDITHAVLRSVHEFLGGPTSDGDEWRFDFGEHLQSNWGAVYGGALAAGALAVARSATPERSPRSMHIQMVRSVPSGPARATASVRHLGRTVATVEVDVFDQRRKLAAIALLTMVTPDGVAGDYDRAGAAPPFDLIEKPISSEETVRGAEAAGLVVTLGLNTSFSARNVMPRAENFRTSVDGTLAVATECTVPWEELEHTGPEAACLVADSAVASPVLDSYIPVENVGPNPDLTLRFTTAPATRVIYAASNMLSVQRGTTTTGIEVHAGDNQLAHGLATSLLLRPS